MPCCILFISQADFVSEFVFFTPPDSDLICYFYPSFPSTLLFFKLFFFFSIEVTQFKHMFILHFCILGLN